MRTLAVVGTGLLGCRVAREAAESGWRVAALDRDPRALDAVRPWASAGTVELDVTDAAATRQAMTRIAPHTVVHTASRIPAAAPSEAEQAERLREYGVNAASAVRAAGDSGAARLVLISSLAVYDLRSTAGPLAETLPPRPRSLYGRGKQVEELMAAKLLHGSGTQLTVLRPVGIYGPGPGSGKLHRRLRALCDEAGSGKPVCVDDFFHGREYLHVSDAARAVVAAADPRRPPGVYNVATGRVSTSEDIAAVLRDAGLRATAQAAPGSCPLLETGHAERSLGFRARVSLADGLRELLALPTDRRDERSDRRLTP